MVMQHTTHTAHTLLLPVGLSPQQPAPATQHPPPSTCLCGRALSPTNQPRAPIELAAPRGLAVAQVVEDAKLLAAVDLSTSAASNPNLNPNPNGSKGRKDNNKGKEER